MTTSTRPDPQTQALCSARRRLATVLIDGLDPAGLQAAKQLIQWGIGTLMLCDDRPVTASDTDFPRTARGMHRSHAASRLLDPGDGSTVVIEVPAGATASGVDVHLVLRSRPRPQQLHSQLRAACRASAAVLPVVGDAQAWRLGPLLSHQGGLCPDCLLHHGLLPAPPETSGAAAAAPAPEAERPADAEPLPEPERPAETAQGSDPSHRQQPDPLLQAASHLAVHQIQVLVEGQRPAAVQTAQLITDRATGHQSSLSISPHPECACLTAVEPLAG
ncbi:hypothetical protein [Nesterenkonia sp.]|uniref:hypothetical protein n=1 Tax=Nesterenkonia sp. TaxID=704201 RepID=UPI0026199345|nr:hypothetical protein [Nesterenkonia sp.]